MASQPLKFNPFSFLDQFVPINSVADNLLDKLADKFEAAKPVTLKNGVLTFNKSGSYSIETLPNGKVKIVFDNGPETVLTKAQWLSVTSFNLADANAHLDLDVSELGGRVIDGNGYVNLTGAAFAEADQTANGKFEPGSNLDAFVSNLLADHPHDMAFVISHLTINGNTADAFKLVWD
jgi:hypothetical protein